MSEYIRRLVDRDLAQSCRQVDRAVVFDLGESKGSDVASAKDHMIGESGRVVKHRACGMP